MTGEALNRLVFERIKLSTAIILSTQWCVRMHKRGGRLRCYVILSRKCLGREYFGTMIIHQASPGYTYMSSAYPVLHRAGVYESVVIHWCYIIPHLLD